ncbi:MAG: metal-sensitive transcriptional regulator [Actinomycetospora chiangmaiensis]|nr:metal-sensitive transcriptional regulator [Actinomycetospora chiangmaiensis]
MEGRVVGERILLTRDEAARRPLVQRLNRIEGQIRGLRGMIEEDRYCLDEIQQINAITAALREVALAIVGQHVAAGVKIAAQSDTPEDAAIEDVMRVLRAAMRREG